MPGSVTHHITLRTRADADEVGLRLLTDENGRLMYSWELAPSLAPDVTPEDVSYGQFTEDQELTWKQNDWSGGALQFYYSAAQPNRYALADRIWAATPNELSLGPAPKEVTFGVRNGAAQLNATTGWTASGITISVVTTAPHTGERHFQGLDWSTSDYAEFTVIQTEQPAARWQSQTIVLTARVRGSAAGGTMRMQIVETGGASTPTTNGSTVRITTSYQTITATVSVQADTTGITGRIEMSADGGSDRTIYFDSAQAFAGSIAPNAKNARMRFMNGDLYCVTNLAVWKLDEANDYWSLQKVHAAITGFSVWDDRLLVGQGESTAYQYSDVQDATVWTAASGGGNKANFFGKTLNVNGEWAAVKTLNDDELYLTTDPTGTPTWGSALEVGKDDHDILQVYELDGTLGVAKEDGFYQYLTLDGNRFANMYPGAEAMADVDNFSRGIMHGGLFYTIVGEGGLIRWTGTRWEDLSDLLRNPAFTELGFRIRALGTDGKKLYVLLEDLNADSITKECWLFSLQQFRGGAWEVHSLTTMVMSDALDIQVFKSSGGTNRFLYINGDINDEAFTHRIQLPNRSDTPRRATNPDMALSGFLITPYMDWDRAQVEKSIDRLRTISETLTTQQQEIAIAYEIDNETSFTDINASNSVFSISPQQGITFTEGVTARRIRFKITMTSISATVTGVLKAFVLEANWRPPRFRVWRMTAALEDRVRNLQGVTNTLPLARQINRLTRLKNEVSPLKMVDIDNDEHRAHIISMSEGQVMVSPVAGQRSRYARGLSIVLRETLTLAGEPWDSGIRWGELYWG